MSSLFILLAGLIQLYILVLIARVVLDIVQMTARDWRPTGGVLVAVNLVYRVTDPPLRFLGRFIPPLRVGAVAFDLGFIILVFALTLLARVLMSLA
ncbi:MAG: YggT family protein [Actinomycetaceae bacterium]|nr:YggT family protein [Actinomycetaceae bacterium]